LVVPQHWSTPGASHVVAGTSTSAQTRKPPGKISTHFEPGHCASLLQSPEPDGAPPAPLVTLLLVVPPLVAEPLATLLVALAPPLPDVPALEPPVPAAPVVSPLVVAVVEAPPAPVGAFEPPQPAHVSTVRAVQVKIRITVTSGHRCADPAEIQADRRIRAADPAFATEARGVI
jgi:hypothetical protein